VEQEALREGITQEIRARIEEFQRLHPDVCVLFSLDLRIVARTERAEQFQRLYGGGKPEPFGHLVVFDSGEML
jgi:hypothetical protein